MAMQEHRWLGAHRDLAWWTLAWHMEVKPLANRREGLGSGWPMLAQGPQLGIQKPGHTQTPVCSPGWGSERLGIPKHLCVAPFQLPWSLKAIPQVVTMYGPMFWHLPWTRVGQSVAAAWSWLWSHSLSWSWQRLRPRLQLKKHARNLGKVLDHWR